MIFSLILLVFKSPKSSIQSFCAPNIILFAFAQMTTTADTLPITPVYLIFGTGLMPCICLCILKQLSVSREPVLRYEFNLSHCPPHAASRMSDFHVLLNPHDNCVIRAKHEPFSGFRTVLGQMRPHLVCSHFPASEFGGFTHADNRAQSIPHHVR